MPYAPIESYGVIGDLRTVALVSTEASLDFLCLPDFDSPTVFAALLDDKQGGRFSITPLLAMNRRKQLYLPDTNILITRSLSEKAVAEVIDYMPIAEKQERHQVVRTVRVIRGEMTFRVECCPKFDYGRVDHRCEQAGETGVEFTANHADGLSLRLDGTVPLQAGERNACAQFCLQAGGEAFFVLEWKKEKSPPVPLDKAALEEIFRSTVDFWRSWIAKSTYTGRWREMVHRSALLLKLLTSRDHGSIIAAPTFGLPEHIGGERNWDYRYTWIRDAAFTLYAFMRLGYTEEARRFMLWMKDRISVDAKQGPLQVMYRANGEQDLEETVLDHWEGHQASKPVRIGNAASTQLQLDIYGELMDAVYLAVKYGDGIPYDGWKNVCRLVEWVSQNWTCPDEGIWEVRGGRKEFLHSRVMCWVAVDRALRLAEKRSLPAPVEEWQKLRAEIYEDVFHRFWDEERQCFVAYPGADFVDASMLLMPLMRFISPIDPRWLSTLKKIESDLTEDALVYRYNSEGTGVDGLRGGEGTFAACSFWYIECLARSHQLEKARLLFEKMISYANHLGLYAEELGPSGEHLGNFPQALTHLALVSAASYLDRALSQTDRGEWR